MAFNASIKTDWEKFYNEDGIIVTDRYVTSNMVHQASKIKDLDDDNTLEYKHGSPKFNAREYKKNVD